MPKWKMLKWDAIVYSICYWDETWDTEFNLFEAKSFFPNILQEQSELKIPPQEKEKGFKAVLSQPCHVEVSHRNFLVHTLVCEEKPVGMLLHGQSGNGNCQPSTPSVATPSVVLLTKLKRWGRNQNIKSHLSPALEQNFAFFQWKFSWIGTCQVVTNWISQLFLPRPEWLRRKCCSVSLLKLLCQQRKNVLSSSPMAASKMAKTKRGYTALWSETDGSITNIIYDTRRHVEKVWKLLQLLNLN